MSEPLAMKPKPKFRDSAAVVLIRGEGARLDTFWVLRSDAVSVQPGFRAFIGGKVDAGDADLPMDGVPELAGATSEAQLFERASRACAIRESFEETGVLLGLIGPAPDAATLAALWEDVREERRRFADVVAERGWRFDARALVPAGRWQTPAFAPVRFDTLFFVARVPPGQEPSVVEGELASGEWVKPLDALDRYRHGHETFAAPILWNLIALAEGEHALAERLAMGPQRSATPFKRIELQWGVVLHPMRTKPLPPATHTNAFLIGESEMMLLDPGSDDPGELAQLFTAIDALAAEGRKLALVVLTHHHSDHTAGAKACRERYGARVVGHRLLGERMALDLAVKDGDWLPLVPGIGDWNMQVLHTPGHTQDSISLWHPRTRTLFCGDLIPGGPGSVIIDPPDGDMGAYLGSLARVAALAPRTIFPAHGSPQGAAVKRIHKMIAHRKEREALVLAALDANARPAAALLEQSYPDTPRELWAYAERSLLAHLLLLERDGRAVRSGDAWSTSPR